MWSELCKAVIITAESAAETSEVNPVGEALHPLGACMCVLEAVESPTNR